MDYSMKVLMLLSWVTSSWVNSAPRQPRLSLAEPMPNYFYNNINGYPGTYAFGYDVLDAATGNTQYRNEERYPNGTVVGNYGYLDPAGRAHRYRYIADEKGYRVMRDRPNPFTTPIVNPNAIINTEGDTVTWKRKKPQRFNVEARDEKTFPNGTLVGRYQYVDAQGNQVHVKYFADGNSYSIDLKGYKIPEVADEATQNSTPAMVKPTNEEADTLVPLKLDFPVIDKIYTIENRHNYTNDVADNDKSYRDIDENDDENAGYNIYGPVLKIPKAKTYVKNKKARKAIRKIRQALDSYVRKNPAGL